MRTRIKICGLTREADLDAAIEAGADAIGFVFYARSPRAVSAERAQALARRVPAWVSVVGLFVNAPRAEILATADRVGLSHIQLHGDESPAQCQGLGRPVIKALRVAPGPEAASQLAQGVLAYAGCQAVLLDSDSSGFGGSGQGFDWDLISPALLNDLQQRGTWVLSGGLESESVGQAIERLRPPCVDVSSGVERMGADGGTIKGEKDAQRIRQFVLAVQQADKKRL